VPADTMLEPLSGLLDKSVLIRDDDAEPARYRLLDTVRQYGLHRLTACGEAAEAQLRRRHRDWYLDLARRFDADWFGPRQLAWLRRLRAALGYLQAVLTFSLSKPCEAPAELVLAARLFHYWFAVDLMHGSWLWIVSAV